MLSRRYFRWFAGAFLIMSMGTVGCGPVGNPPLHAGAQSNISGSSSSVTGQAFTNSLGQKFVLIPAGTFTMGSPPGEPGREYDEIQHQVTISRAFYLQVTEVTVGQWRDFIRATGYVTEAERSGEDYVFKGVKWVTRPIVYWDRPEFSQGESHPVTSVSWNDVREFVGWLNRTDGRGGYRLPTEAEWEYAARAGSNTIFPWGNDPDLACGYANVADRSSAKAVTWSPIKDFKCDDGFTYTAPVASLRPNAWGLFDMIGNVWEWCDDWYGDPPAGPLTDPQGPSSGSFRVGRGGSWLHGPKFCRSASRVWFKPDGGYSGYLGFRLARTP